MPTSNRTIVPTEVLTSMDARARLDPNGFSWQVNLISTYTHLAFSIYNLGAYSQWIAEHARL